MSGNAEAGSSTPLPLTPVTAFHPMDGLVLPLASSTSSPATSTINAAAPKKPKAKTAKGAKQKAAKEGGEGGSSMPKKRKPKGDGAKRLPSTSSSKAASRKNSIAGEGIDYGSMSREQIELLSLNTSRSGSVVNDNQSTTGRKSSAKGKGRGRGRGSMRADSRGSRATSARMSMSVVPGQHEIINQEEARANGEVEGQEGEEDEEEDEEEEAPEEEDEDEEGGGQGLEEGEWHRQEAIQKARSTAMGPLMKAMDDDQQDRYAVYRQSFLEKRTIKRVSEICSPPMHAVQKLIHIFDLTS
jgi:hypothetical protein